MNEPTTEAMNEEVQALRQQLVGVLKSRAMVYAAIYDEIGKELGEDKALEIMKRAVYARGAAMGQGFRKFAPGDFTGLRDGFLAVLPDRARPFEPEVLKCDGSGFDVKFHACPTKQAWIDAGYAPERVARLCQIAGAIDNGTFEGAGFAIEAETWQPGGEGCCLLRIGRRPEAASPGSA